MKKVITLLHLAITAIAFDGVQLFNGFQTAILADSDMNLDYYECPKIKLTESAEQWVALMTPLEQMITAWVDFVVSQKDPNAPVGTGRCE